MIELQAGRSLEVTLREDAQNGDRVVISLQTQSCEVDLTPHQARVLATELIMAVNRAEVSNNLKRGQGMVRGESATQKRGLFSQAFAK
jgi:hypothetical protein